MLTADLTEGMSTKEVLIVFLCAHCSESELERIRLFLEEWHGK